MPVNIHNKEYFTVAERIAKLRNDHPNYTVETQLILQDDDKVIMKALIFADKTTVIVDGEVAGDADELHLIATGYAEEIRGSTNINKTSALENAETSAVGRALAFFGLAGTEIASADEVAGAIHQQAAMELIEYNALVREHWDSITECKRCLLPIHGEHENQVNVTEARAALAEIPEAERKLIWRAPTKGGCLTTEERALLKEKPEDAL